MAVKVVTNKKVNQVASILFVLAFFSKQTATFFRASEIATVRAAAVYLNLAWVINLERVIN